MALECLIYLYLKKEREKKKGEKNFYIQNLSCGGRPWNLEVIVHCKGKETKQTQNKRYKHNNLKSQSKVIFLALNFLSYIRIRRCFFIESMFLSTKNSSSPKKQPTSGNSRPLAHAPGSDLYFHSMCSFWTP